MKSLFSITIIFILNLNLAFSQTWETNIIDETGTVGAYPSLKIDSDNNPHIAYLDGDNNLIKYAWFNGVWNIENTEIETQNTSKISLALDANNKPHIAFDKVTMDGTIEYEIHYANKVSGSWVSEQIQNGTNFGKPKQPDLVIYNNIPYISYYDRLYGMSLHLAYKSGSTWYDSNIHQDGDCGTYSSMIFDSYGNEHIAFFSFTSDKVKYVDGGNSWNIEILGSSYGSASISIALNSTNSPAIAYGQGGAMTAVIKTGTNFSTSSIGSGYEPSIGINADNNAYIAYGDANGPLRIATNATGSWVSEQIYDNGVSCYNPSFKFDNNDNLHIAFYDDNSGDLVYSNYTQQTTSIITDNYNMHFSIYPNPTNDYIIIDNYNSEKINIITLTGKVILKDITSNKIDVSRLKAGIYLIKSDNYFGKFVKE